MKVKEFFFGLIICLNLNIKAQDTLTVMAFNILNYPGSNATKADTLKPIIQYVQPDIFMITELTSSTGVATIMNDALNVDGVTSYQKATYYNGPDTDNMLFYNEDKLKLYSQYEIPTALRNISEYVLYYDNGWLTSASDTVFIYCYMAHLKASSGSVNEQKRNQEAILLKNYMDSRTNIENVILGGDFNFYKSSEAGHNTILNGGNVVLLDPIASLGNWNNNSAFASIHTQSTRSVSIGDGGSYGGMDDRFDFIFFSPDVELGTNGLTYVANSYEAVGNDGNHFNKSINDAPTNTAVPANIADALFYMSDHLPVVLKLSVHVSVGTTETVEKQDWKGFISGGNFYFKSENREEKLDVFVYDVQGKLLYTKTYKELSELSMSFQTIKQGLYFVKVLTKERQQNFKLFKQ